MYGYHELLEELHAARVMGRQNEVDDLVLLLDYHKHGQGKPTKAILQCRNRQSARRLKRRWQTEARPVGFAGKVSTPAPKVPPIDSEWVCPDGVARTVVFNEEAGKVTVWDDALGYPVTYDLTTATDAPTAVVAPAKAVAVGDVLYHAVWDALEALEARAPDVEAACEALRTAAYKYEDNLK